MWSDVVKNKDYKRFVGDSKNYKKIGLLVYNLLLKLGLQKHHNLLDIGCGSLRVGIHLINYLEQSHYHGIEPNAWLVDYMIKNDIKNLKQAKFNYNFGFDLDVFNKRFDFILANSIFVHASESQIKKCLSELPKVMHEDSIFVFNFFEGEDNKKADWSYPEAVTYSIDKMKELLKEFNYEFFDFDYPSSPKWVKVRL